MSNAGKSVAVSDDVVTKTVRRHGTGFITELCTVLRQVRLHGAQHPKVLDSARKVVQGSSQLAGKSGDVVIEVRDEQVHINDVRVRCSAGGSDAFRLLVAGFLERGIGCLSLDAGVTPEAVAGFAAAFHDAAPPKSAAAAVKPEEALARMRQMLLARRVGTVSVDPPGAATGTSGPGRQRAIEAYCQVVEVLRELHTGVKDGKPVAVRRAKRAMHTLVEVAEEDEAAVLALASVKNLAEYAVAHAINTAILAVALGGRLELPRKLVGELGLAALFLDLGMLPLEDDVVAKAGTLTDAERKRLERHPVEAAKTFLAAERMVDVVIRCLRTSFEHHRGFDRKGYPRVAPEQPNALPTEIVAICDAYDALTSPRPYREQPMSPPEALQVMLEAAGKRYDPALLKVFVNMIGVYPVGTIVRLSNGELGTVQRASTDPGLMDRPKVKLFADRNGRFQERVVDLAERSGDGQFVVGVEQVLKAEEVGLEVGGQLAVL